METLEGKLQEIGTLWISLDHWKAKAIDWNINNPDDQITEPGMFEATFYDVMEAMSIILESANDSIGVHEFGTSSRMAEVLNYLCGAIDVLSVVFTLHDGDRRYDVDIRDVSTAYKNDLLHHPETDEPVEDWQSHTYMHYKLTPTMMRLKNDYKSGI